MANRRSGIENPAWGALFKAGGVAALLAGLLFRRNIGAEVSLFTGAEAIPQSAAGWFALLQNSPFLGLSFLAIFDVANYVLVGLIFLALGVALWPSRKTLVAIAFSSGMMGIAVSLAGNIALTMWSLSQQHAAATSESQRAALLTAGQAVLAFHDPLAVYPNTALYLSLLLVAVAGLLFSIAMLHGHSFGRTTALVGLVASGCDLGYCLTVPFAPFLRAWLLAAGGLMWMIWHLMVARRLLQLARE